MSTVDLDKPITQGAFGAMVGISQTAVTKLLDSGTLTRGDTCGKWLLDYCASKREAASGAGEGENLAYERAVATRVARERDEIRLAVDRQEYAAVELLQLCVATMGTTIVSILQPLHLMIQKRCKALTPEDVVMIQQEVAKACAAAESACLQVLQPTEEDEDEIEAELA